MSFKAEAEAKAEAKAEAEARRPGVAKLRPSTLTAALGPREAAAILRRLREDLTGDPDEFVEAVDRILAGEPVQYVTGIADFYGLRLHVTPAVLIPRPETEELVEWVLADHPRGTLRNVIDVGTGSGCIPLAFKSKRPDWTCTGIDVSYEALAIARENADELSTAVEWLHGDVLRPTPDRLLPASHHIIVSNPPYIPPSERDRMSASTLAREPDLALFVPEDDPLIFYRRIAEIGRNVLTDHGRLYFETNEHNNPAVVELLRERGYTDVTPRRDLQGKWRMVRATRPPAPAPTRG